MSMVTSVKQYFDTLPERFQRDAAKGVQAVFQFDLTGPGGAAYHVAVDGPTIAVAEGFHTAPTVTFKMAADDYLKLSNGKMNGHLAFATGKMKISGNMMVAIKMQALFPPAK